MEDGSLGSILKRFRSPVAADNRVAVAVPWTKSIASHHLQFDVRTDYQITCRSKLAVTNRPALGNGTKLDGESRISTERS